MSDLPPTAQPHVPDSAPASPTAGALLVATAPTPATAEAGALLWRPLHGRPLAGWALAALAALAGDTPGREWPGRVTGLSTPKIAALVIVARAERAADAEALIAGLPENAPPMRAVTSAPDWRASLAAGLAALPAELTWVIIHDAARPLLTDAMVSGGFVAARDVEGVGLGAGPVSDTLKRIEVGRVVETPPRARLRHLTPPLVIRRDLLARALQTPSAHGLAEIALASGARVALYALASPNPTICSDADWPVVEALLDK